MSITAELADGRKLEFPDGTEPAVIQRTVKKVLGQPELIGTAAFGPSVAQGASFGAEIGQNVGNLAAGAVRGAGSIGATILRPIDKLAGDDIDRRTMMDQGLQTMGADPASTLYRLGKVGGEVAGTAGVGSALAGGLRAIPVVASKAPGLVGAIETSGMTAPGLAGAKALAARTAGGAITGAASAGLVDPSQAGSGALIGGALPGLVQAAGAAGQLVGNVLRGPAQSAEQRAAINAARQAGYVIPPTQANPSLKNRLIEGVAGKITTAQNASARNAAVTNGIAARELGLPPDVAITRDSLKQVRDIAGQAYDAIAQTGTITPTPAYESALKAIEAPYLKAAQGFPNAKPSPVLDLVESLRSPSFGAAAAVEKIKQLRAAADDAFRSGSPGATDLARASRSAAKALEDVLDTHLSAGSPQLLNDYREARQLIAKTYSVEKALNPATGTIDAKQLAAQLKQGKPLSGGLRDAAEFAGRFPKAAQTPESMGSLPQWSPLDWSAGTIGSLVAGNPLPMLAVGVRPGARALALSPPVQNNLVQGGFRSLVPPEQVQQLMYQAAPVVGSR